MEAALRNLCSCAELLTVAAHSGEVQQWDHQTLTRAFLWARYCEDLFTRYHMNPAIRRIIEKQLQLTNQNLRAAFPGHTELSFSDLSQCQHLLLVALLNNPDLPISIMKTLFSPGDIHQHQDVTSLCSHIIQYRSACKVLGAVTEGSAVGADAEVQGLMLMERLGALQAKDSDLVHTEHFLDSTLQGHEGAAGHFCRVIAAALLTTENSHKATQDFLLDWLQKRQSVLQLMCIVLPTTLLTDLAKEHLTFRDMYRDVLKHWASDMQYDMNEGEWTKTGTDGSVSFKKLTEHFLALFEAEPSLREDVEKELNALKKSDGDFDVKGLSVWGDLLSALNT